MKIFIAGCFDLLHEGHLHLLKTAKNFGGSLTVAINKDSDIRVRKGLDRPFDNEQTRVFKLLNCGYVDQVLVFDGDPHLLELIKFLEPDIIAVGDDYTKDKVVGAKECEEWGGRVEIVKKIPNISTTNIIENKKWEDKTDSTY